ncbi:MAG: MerR family transcriptional regulator [Chitinispirillaceae bacterium]|jgi:DNA-binding transcriptional MerR regulator|nr:MerR family transcriptional regulator [Chitinispirillaceae bacterium]
MISGTKIYYSISEVCSMTGLEPHVLRYWESEFPQLRPKKNRAGNRAYREKDIEMVQYIKRLLYEEKFTIPGAKKRLSETRAHNPEPAVEPAAAAISQPPAADMSTLREVKQELAEVLELLTK